VFVQLVGITAYTGMWALAFNIAAVFAVTAVTRLSAGSQDLPVQTDQDG